MLAAMFSRLADPQLQGSSPVPTPISQRKVEVPDTRLHIQLSHVAFRN